MRHNRGFGTRRRDRQPPAVARLTLTPQKREFFSLYDQAAGNVVAIKPPTVGDGHDVTESERAAKGFTTKDYYHEKTYVVDPALEKLYRQYFQTSYILPDDDQAALQKGNTD